MGCGRHAIGIFTSHAQPFGDISKRAFLVCTRSIHCAAASRNQQEKVAFVSGGSRGLGLEYVRQLLQRDGQRCISQSHSEID